jgi:hypothetical protein
MLKLFIKPICIIFLLFPFVLWAQKPLKVKSKNKLNIAYWNTENFYDTLFQKSNDTGIYVRNWNSEKYMHKVNLLVSHMNQMFPKQLPHILALSEIENESILQDIISHPSIAKAGYLFKAGKKNENTPFINAVIYNPKKVTLISDTSIRISNNLEDVLLANFAAKKDTFQVVVLNFVNHTFLTDFEKKLPLNQNAVHTSRLNATLLSPEIKKYPLVLLGSFYEEKNNLIISVILSAHKYDSMEYKKLKYANLSHNLDSIDAYTYYTESQVKEDIKSDFYENLPNSYQYNLQGFDYDHALLEKSFFDKRNKWNYMPNSYMVYKPMDLVNSSPRYRNAPLKTFFNQQWQKGFSDHYAIAFSIYYAKKRK